MLYDAAWASRTLSPVREMRSPTAPGNVKVHGIATSTVWPAAMAWGTTSVVGSGWLLGTVWASTVTGPVASEAPAG